MNAKISMEGLWAMIQTLSLSNQKWLAGKLQENIREKETEYISKEEILAGIKSGLEDMKAGRKRPLDELIKELEDAV